MVSLRCVVATTSSAVLRLAAFVFLRWIPGHHLPPIVFTSLAIYLTSLFALGKTAIDASEKDSRSGSTATEKKKNKGQSNALITLLSGLPSSRSRIATASTIAVNVTLAVLTLDFLLRGLVLYPSNELTFARIGYVSPTTAKLLVRDPNQSHLPVAVRYQEAMEQQISGKWVEEGVVYSLTNETDYTAAITLRNLKPQTRYRYSLSNNLTGVFQTGPAAAGSAASSQVSFVTSSCLKANFPYNPFSHPLRIAGLEQLSRVVANLPSVFRPQFMLFLGDFIYVDVPRRFGSSVSHYRSEYRRVYSSPSWSTPSGDGNRAIDLPWLHMLDDHEIENDWHKGNSTAPYPAARDPYVHYHVSVNPPIPAAPFARPENTSYFSFVRGPASFFILDTRTFRSEPGQPNSTMLGSAQLQSLLAYLGHRPERVSSSSSSIGREEEEVDVRWKIVASSVPFTKNWRVGTADTWGGYLHERQAVLEAMWRAERELGVRVVLLSGDRHEFGATRFPDPLLAGGSSDDDGSPLLLPGQGVHEFCVGPLNMFYLPIRTYRQTDDEDIAIKYVPDGNHKFGLIDIVDEDDASVLTYTLYVDGEVRWKYRLSVPVLDVAAARSSSSSHAGKARWPAGKVLLDDSGSHGWAVWLKSTAGRIEESAVWVWRSAAATYRRWLKRPARRPYESQ